MTFGFWVKTALLLKFVPQRELMSTLELSEIFQPTTLLIIGLRPLSYAKSPLMEVLSFLAFLIH